MRLLVLGAAASLGYAAQSFGLIWRAVYAGGAGSMHATACAAAAAAAK